MKDEWRIIIYETLDGERPAEAFIVSLDIKARNKIVRTLEHLEEFGPELGYPHLKKVTGTSLWELRILGNDSIRILYITLSGKTFLLLHGFILLLLHFAIFETKLYCKISLEEVMPSQNSISWV